MGSFSVINNISAIVGQNHLNINNVNLNRTLERMSSGLRINTGADDAAGLQIADTLKASYNALNQAVRNANDGISFLRIADGALSEITGMLHRMVTLASEAANEPIDQDGCKALDNEFQELQAEIARLAQQCNFNGTKLFDIGTLSTATPGTLPTDGREFGATLDLFVGDISAASEIAVKIGYIVVDETDSTKVTGFINIPMDYKDGDPIPGQTGGLVNTHLFVDPTEPSDPSNNPLHPLFGKSSNEAAALALTDIKNALNAVSTMRGLIGAGMNRLYSAVSVMQTQATNTLAAESQIRDANMAQEITLLTRYQILAQTGIAALAHSNTNSQTVLGLLQR